LRRQDGTIRLAKGCCIVIEHEWDETLRALTEAQQEIARLKTAMRQYVTDSECYCCDEGIALPVPCTHCVMKELAGTKEGA